MKFSTLRTSRASLLAPACLSLAALLTAAAPQAFAQDFNRAAIKVDKPVKMTHIYKPSDAVRGEKSVFARPRPQAFGLIKPNLTPVNTGSGIVFTCDPNIDQAVAGTCAYLNTSVAANLNATFTNANAAIYIQYAAVGLGQSTQYPNQVTYSQFVSALNANTNKSAEQTTALSSLSTYDAPIYGQGNVVITSALGANLGFDPTTFTGITSPETGENACTPGTSGCYDVVVQIANASEQSQEGFTIFYDQQGGTEGPDQYDFYSVTAHEVDEALGTSSCVNGLSACTDPSANDLFRFASSGHLASTTSPSGAAGQYFSYDGGKTNPLVGIGGMPLYFNDTGDGDYSDYASSSPDCSTNYAVQDAYDCPGTDAGHNILNDGGSEIIMLKAIGYDVPAAASKAALTTPTPGSTLTGSAVTFSWTPATGATTYALNLGTASGGSNLYNSGHVTTTSVTATGLPTNGSTIYAELWAYVNNAWVTTNYTYTAASKTTAALTSPAPGSTLTGSSVTFSWTPATGATTYALNLGTTTGGSNLYNSGHITTTSATANGLPTNGSTIYAELWAYVNNAWVTTNYTYTAASKTTAALTTPTPGSILSGSRVTFSWTPATGATTYALNLGTTSGGSNLYNSGHITTTSATATGLPTNSSTIYAELWAFVNNAWVTANYTYTAQ